MENPEVALIVDELEEKAEVTSLAESSKEMKAASNPDSSSQTKLEKTAAKKGEEGSSEKLSAKEITYDSQASFFLMWKKIFLASCVFAVLLDPLFLYIPIIKQDMSCLGVDKNLKITTLILRSLTDLFYIMDIAIQFYRSENCSGLISTFRHRHCSILQFLWKLCLPAIAKTVCQSYILIDVLAILPLPQVLILILFSKVRGSSSLNARKVIMNSFVLMQYLPRILRIYLSCKQLRRTPNGGTGETPTWVKGVLNFFMYILASHVLGAVWYFFAIQRVIACWQHACGNGNDCESTFGCHRNHTFRNITFLNQCPISTPNTTLFDFGIFTSVLQSGLPGSTNHLQKFSNCFCWGLRNLSSLGSNLQPSINTWENLFVAFISIIGLLLFIYLIGNLQTYMQLDVARIEEHRHRMKVERKMEEKSGEIELWLSKNGIPERSKKDIKLQIMKKVQQELEENRDVDLENVLPIIAPLKLQNYVRNCMPLTRLKQVPTLHYMDGSVLKEICELLKRMKYTKNDIIIREDDPLKMMLFIVEGNVSIEKRNHSGSSQRGAGELYGERLLTWPSRTSFPAVLPSATESVKAIGDVEALVLMASDMESVGFKFSFLFKKFNKLEEQMVNLQTSTRVFTAQEMKKATNNYHETEIIGEGGFGIVYKGTLPDKKVVAIKVLKGRARVQRDTFVNEIGVLSQINHKNLVTLLGCCLETESPLLVYEFINNGTLYDHIHKRNGKGTLSWELRMNVAVDSARGLQYLHNFTSMPIIHRDVKATNILLDENYTGKVIDIDASKVEEYDEDEFLMTTQIAGTFGLCDPEYVIGGRMTEKSDVYSFGVVLAELITSQKVIDRQRPEGERVLASLFNLSVERGRLDRIVDSEIINETNFEIVEKVADLARRCLRSEGEKRPTMKEVVSELEGLQIMAKHRDGGRIHFPRSPKDTDYLLGSPSYVYGENITGEGVDSGSRY